MNALPSNIHEIANTRPDLQDCVRQTVREYLRTRGDQTVPDLFRLVIGEIESPLLGEVMSFCGGNVTRAADMLGITRATLRKKLHEHGLR